MAKITFYGGVGTVTGSKYLLEHNDKKVLVDCGLFQGLKELRERNWLDPPFEPSDLDAIVINPGGYTHSSVAIRDGDGNLVSLTLSVGSPFGVRQATPQAGLVLNDELTDFDHVPPLAGDGDDAGPAANRPAPGAAPRTSMTPLVLVHGGGLFMQVLEGQPLRISVFAFDPDKPTFEPKISLRARSLSNCSMMNAENWSAASSSLPNKGTRR